MSSGSISRHGTLVHLQWKLQEELSFLKALVAYRTIDPSTANAALKSFGGHLWYLSESLVGLAFFDTGVSLEEKATMNAALLKDGNTDPLPRIKLDESCIVDTSLTDLVTSNSKRLFTLFACLTIFYGRTLLSEMKMIATEKLKK